MDSYLVITIRNISFNTLKKEKKYREAEDIDEKDISISEDIISRISYNRLVECISSLKQTDRDIMYLRVTLELDYKHIAAALSISEDAARQRFRHAKNQLVKILEKEGLL
jgi:RNA polymerase sigma factor (sigma-70 family)